MELAPLLWQLLQPCMYPDPSECACFFPCCADPHALGVGPEAPVLDSRASCNNDHGCSDFNTTGIQLLTVSQAGSLKSRHQQGCVLSQGSFLASSSLWWPQHSLACGHVSQVSASIFTWMPPESPCMPFSVSLSLVYPNRGWSNLNL